MIRVLVDRYNINREDVKLELSTFLDYTRFWDEIVRFGTCENEEIIVLKNPYLEKYFHNLQDKFEKGIEITYLSPRLQWQYLWKFELPEEINEEEIAYLLQSKELEKLKVLKNKKLGVLCILLKIREFSNFTIEESLLECILREAETKYPEILDDVINDLLPLLSIGKKAFWQRLKEEKGEKDFLLNTIKSFIVQSYPSDSQPFKKYHKESLTYSGFDFPAYLTTYIDEKFKRTIKIYLKTIDENRICSLISGKLSEELEVVSNFLRENPVQDNTYINALLKKATEYPEIYEEFQRYIPILAPSREINENNITRWIEQYFAFYLYTRYIGKPSKTEEFVKVFEEFILKHYYSSTEFFTQHSILVIRKKLEEYLRKKTKVLLLVIDGLSYAYCERMRNIFNTQGSFLFSTLPTITKVNKQRILSGLFDVKEPYENILLKFYRDYHCEETNSSIQDLKSFLQKDYDFYVYWENQFDAYIHQRMTFEKRIKDHEKMLIRISVEIRDFLKDGGIVLILGDHGYTTLPQNNDSVINVLDGEVKITHNRILEKKEAKLVLSSQNVHWIDENITIPQCYHCFKSLPYGATHGGATPEELIVPFFILEEEQEKIFKPLEIELSEEKFSRKKTHETKLILYNPNFYALRLTSLSFHPPIIKIFKPLPLLLEQGKNIFEIQLDLSTLTTEVCKVFVEYQIDNTKYQINFTILTTGAIKETFDDWE